MVARRRTCCLSLRRRPERNADIRAMGWNRWTGVADNDSHRIAGRHTMVPRRKMDRLQHVRSESAGVENRHAQVTDGGKVDGRAANCTAASFPTGSARLFGTRLPPHVRRNHRGRYSEAAHLRRLERWRAVRWTRWKCRMELDAGRQKHSRRGNERLGSRSELSERQPLCCRRGEWQHATIDDARWHLDRTGNISEWKARCVDRIPGDKSQLSCGRDLRNAAGRRRNEKDFRSSGSRCGFAHLGERWKRCVLLRG